MAPFSRRLTAPMTRTTTWFGKNAPPPKVEVLSATAIDENLNCSALIKGNRKSPNTWNFNYSRRAYSKGREVTKNRDYMTEYVGWNIGPAPDFGDTLLRVNSPYGKALGKLYENIRGNVDLSIDLAEIGKTTTMIKHAASQLVGLVTSFRRGSLSGAKHAADTFLQWKYGVAPMMATIYELSSRQLLVAIEPVTYRSRSSNNSDTSRSLKNYQGSYVTVTDKVRVSKRCLISLTFSQSSSGISTLSQYTSLNPASIAWELTPFSFVVDWVWDLGGYLRMAETAMLCGLQFQSGFRTDSYLTTCNRINSGAFTDRYGTTSIIDSNGYAESKGMNRVLLSGMPFPELPRIDVDMGSSHLLSAAALLSQFIKNR